MNGSFSAAVLIAGLIQITTASVSAELNSSISNQVGSEDFRWLQVTDDISMSEYREMYRHNIRVLRSAVRSYSEGVAESIGLPEKARRLTGVAASVATNLLTNHDIKFRLNTKRTFALEFRDPAKNDRALYLNYKLKW